jgi:MOSC domain-containing protein YiiM
MARIESIAYRTGDADDKMPQGFNRTAFEEATLITGKGIEGDRKAGHPKRHINFMFREVLTELAMHGYKTDPGEMGEQLIFIGVDDDAIAPGVHVQLGESAVLEVIEPRTGCDKFQTVQGLPPVKHPQMGWIARVIASGPIRVNDPVRVVAVVAEGEAGD